MFGENNDQSRLRCVSRRGNTLTSSSAPNKKKGEWKEQREKLTFIITDPTEEGYVRMGRVSGISCFMSYCTQNREYVSTKHNSVNCYVFPFDCHTKVTGHGRVNKINAQLP